MKVAVYGGGAVGLGIASCLLQSRVKVDIITRSNTFSALNDWGLNRTGIFGDVWFDPKSFGLCHRLEKKNYDFIVVCVKSFDSEIVANEISSILKDSEGHVRVVHCQNGWGNAEIFAKYFPKRNVFSGRLITGFRRSSPNTVEITVHAEAIHLGSLFNEDIHCLYELAKAINDGGIPCRAVSAIEKDLMAKLLYNCALNPLGAIFGVPYGVLAKSPKTNKLMFQLVEEVFLALEGWTTYWSTAEDYMITFYEKLLPATACHESSMLQDIRAGKKTEIDAISGAVVELGLKKGVATPCNAILRDMIRFLEELRHSEMN